MAYEYDVFVSYPRIDPIGPWVQNHFYPTFVKWMNVVSKSPPKVFLDTEIEVGSRWPDSLKKGIATSRCMVAVWAPPYFRSRWCVAEWKSMVAREELLRVDRAKAGLVLPIRFWDGEHFPKDAQETEYEDFAQFTIFLPNTLTAIQFEEAVQKFCERVAERIAMAPKWRKNWPTLEPDPDPEKSLNRAPRMVPQHASRGARKGRVRVRSRAARVTHGKRPARIGRPTGAKGRSPMRRGK